MGTSGLLFAVGLLVLVARQGALARHSRPPTATTDNGEMEASVNSLPDETEYIPGKYILMMAPGRKYHKHAGWIASKHAKKSRGVMSVVKKWNGIGGFSFKCAVRGLGWLWGPG
jgi:hypothetical protein